MVVLEAIRASNKRIATTFPQGLVAVFVGATNGVGEATVLQFAKYVPSPRAYLIGRSQEAGIRIVNECKALNPEGEFTFISKDTSLMRNVDEVCEDLKRQETSINLLFLTIGTMQTKIRTDEGLHYPAALTVHARNRFISNLLPLINHATALRRVVSVFIGTLEGQVKMDDFQGWNMKLMANRDHAASITTLSLEAHQRENPSVSYIHNFPGVVRSGITRGTAGPLLTALKTVFRLIGPLVYMPSKEAGDRHLFLSTSAKYAAGAHDPTAGVPLSNGIEVARGTNGKAGGGVYSIDASGESAKPVVGQTLAGLRSNGMVETVMNTIEADIQSALATKVSA
ncbi:hypothetical protein EV356DRAFT_455682 [Viridothelium virens]|uniref:NAD(P)-binding protein n=1 Tax=Viridothelium virens TaxID=1048519 RepID=A0A6A6GUS2_VIRVR|nr:hypothetical protein EV356DRAFT_455682 [Viridothelium virens]